MKLMDKGLTMPERQATELEMNKRKHKYMHHNAETTTLPTIASSIPLEGLVTVSERRSTGWGFMSRIRRNLN